MRSALRFLRRRCLAVPNLVLDHAHPVIVAEVNAGKLERRPVAPLFQRACVRASNPSRSAMATYSVSWLKR